MKKDGQTGKIAVLMGGVSSERAISLKSGSAVYNALVEENCSALAIDLKTEDEKSLIDQLRKNEVHLVFIALHGHFGEDGEIQEMLDRHGIVYVGSGAHASRMAFNKVLTQTCLKEAGIHVPEFVVADKKREVPENILKSLPYPVFVKPSQEGSSIGISYVANEGDLAQALNLAWQYGDQALIEKAVEGRELTVSIVAGTVLPVVEIRPKNGYFDFVAKYEKGKTEYIVPAELSDDLTRHLQQTAQAVFDLLGCRHFARADFMLDKNNHFFFLEMNTIPGFTETSLLPKAAASAGINFNQLCLKLIGMAYGEKKKITSNTYSS